MHFSGNTKLSHKFLSCKQQLQLKKTMKRCYKIYDLSKQEYTRTRIPVTIAHEGHVFLFYGNGQAVQNHKNKT